MRRKDPQQLWERVIALLLSNRTNRAVARKAGISPSTLQRMMREPGFMEQYLRAKRQLVHDATTILTASANDAARTLKNIFNDRKAQSSARVSAAATTLRLTLEAFELEQLEERIRRLEEQTNAT